ncbi:tryptophan 2,3-dioxygenase family protein [Streptomyces sp. YIM 98790]|uniref:tryptophan 2,3-dioxygenase family protein n=1 Tax=Streptomyces sp. YIM 98790 TaxID=2689077 RepID=UPI001FB773D4|nr:tryptophan 2,3-dioxygenase family protein [Streptomyces sp. YIM 98790]
MDAEDSYQDYLRVDELLSLQEPRSEKYGSGHMALSEHFFIVCHQTCELWLKQILADLSAVEDAFATMRRGDLERAVDLLYRAGALLRLLHEQLVAMERLCLEDFAHFRQFLGSASGAQSAQFHRLERMLGNASRDGTLYRAFVRGVERHGGSVTSIVEAGVDAGTEHRVVEGLLHVGNGYLRWKIGHVGLTSAMLGGTAGTGGSSGVAYLVDRATLPFPELRLLRGKVHQRTAGGPGTAAADRRIPSPD